MITGAARGIGKAIALKFAEEGANIAFTDLVIDENGEATRQEIEAKVVDFNGEDKKISLSMKALEAPAAAEEAPVEE